MGALTASPRVATLLKQVHASRGRLIFALDATGSREAMWDMATSLQAEMFLEAAKIGSLDVQLVSYGGDAMPVSPWISDTAELVSRMRTIRCTPGPTQIERVLAHIGVTHAREKVSAAIFVGDAAEEMPDDLYTVARGLGVPMFFFQEGSALAVWVDQQEYQRILDGHAPLTVEQVYRELARLTGGAYGKFDPGAAKQLGEMLRAVAAFAVGGVAALANQNSDSARLLLGQMKSNPE